MQTLDCSASYEATIDLYSMVHLADEEYYLELQDMLDSNRYDAVLYELIVPADLTSKDELGRRRLKSLSCVAATADDKVLAESYGLTLQINKLDVCREGWWIADMSREALQRSLAEELNDDSSIGRASRIRSNRESAFGNRKDDTSLPTSNRAAATKAKDSKLSNLLAYSLALTDKSWPSNELVQRLPLANLVRFFLWLAPVPEANVLAFDTGILVQGSPRGKKAWRAGQAIDSGGYPSGSSGGVQELMRSSTKTSSPLFSTSIFSGSSYAARAQFSVETVAAMTDALCRGRFRDARKLMFAQMLVGQATAESGRTSVLIGKRNQECVAEVRRVLDILQRSSLAAEDPAIAQPRNSKPRHARVALVYGGLHCRDLEAQLALQLGARRATSAFLSVGEGQRSRKALDGSSSSSAAAAAVVSSANTPSATRWRSAWRIDLGGEGGILPGGISALAILLPAYLALGCFDWIGTVRGLLSDGALISKSGQWPVPWQIPCPHNIVFLLVS